MSKVSKSFRDQAAKELRDSRKKGSGAAQAQSTKRAAGFKALADSEEWLQGEKPRSKTRSPKRK
ncbi:MAG: hypothetical protein AB1490_01190 [Pseudomonadota bacterium]